MVWVVDEETLEGSSRGGSIGHHGSIGHRAKVGVATRIAAGIDRGRASRDWLLGWGRLRGLWSFGSRVRRGAAREKNHAPGGRAHGAFLRYSERTVDGL